MSQYAAIEKMNAQAVRGEDKHQSMSMKARKQRSNRAQHKNAGAGVGAAATASAPVQLQRHSNAVRGVFCDRERNSRFW